MPREILFQAPCAVRGGICRLYDYTDGEILLDGYNIKEYIYQEYIELFAPVFQDFKLLAFPLYENVLMREHVESTEKENLNELLARVGLDERVNSLKNGVDTVLFKMFDADGVEFSGGEQQKLAIARTLYKDVLVVILDEPTAALDPKAEYEIYRHFEDLVGGKTDIYISHRLSSCKFCDRIAVFSDGRIAEYGTHDELAAVSNGIYARMFEAQAQYYR